MILSFVRIDWNVASFKSRIIHIQSRRIFSTSEWLPVLCVNILYYSKLNIITCQKSEYCMYYCLPRKFSSVFALPWFCCEHCSKEIQLHSCWNFEVQSNWRKQSIGCDVSTPGERNLKILDLENYSTDWQLWRKLKKPLLNSGELWNHRIWQRMKISHGPYRLYGIV